MTEHDTMKDRWARLVENLLEDALSTDDPAQMRAGLHRAYAAVIAVRMEAPYCPKLARRCPDACPVVNLTGCGGGTAGDCWRVKAP